MARRGGARGGSVSPALKILLVREATERWEKARATLAQWGNDADKLVAAHESAAAAYERAAQAEEAAMNPPAPCAACNNTRLCRECKGDYIGRDAHGVAWGQCPACHEGACPACKGAR